VLTLIAAAPEPRLTIAAAAVQEALAGLGAALGRGATLAADVACDIFFSGLVADQAEAAARQALATALGTHRIDLVAQGAADRRKRLLLADMESTIIENEMLDELADFLGLREGR
jgi:phosphoserine phosphatase